MTKVRKVNPNGRSKHKEKNVKALKNKTEKKKLIDQKVSSNSNYKVKSDDEVNLTGKVSSFDLDPTVMEKDKIQSIGDKNKDIQDIDSKDTNIENEKKEILKENSKESNEDELKRSKNSKKNESKVLTEDIKKKLTLTNEDTIVNEETFISLTLFNDTNDEMVFDKNKGVNILFFGQKDEVNLKRYNKTHLIENYHEFKIIFDYIMNLSEIKKDKQFKNKLDEMIQPLFKLGLNDVLPIFSVFKFICEFSKNTDAMTKSFDGFAKLFIYCRNLDESVKNKLSNEFVELVSFCFQNDNSNAEFELQIIRSLMSCFFFLSCHGCSLLKAFRHIYNVFIYSTSSKNQFIAQGILIQMIKLLIERVTEYSKLLNDSVFQSKSEQSSFDSKANESTKTLHDTNIKSKDKLFYKKKKDLVIKDTFLIFRVMCRISIKSLESEVLDMKSSLLRSKLFSLYIIYIVLKDHFDLFLNPEIAIESDVINEKVKLITAIKHYLSLCLSKNASSSIPPIFEFSLEIFWLVILNLRYEFKKEISLFWDKIYFPVAEMKTSSFHQKSCLMLFIERICNDPKCLVEFYLNYDCDSAMPNICERLVDYLTKLTTADVEIILLQKQLYIQNQDSFFVLDFTKLINLTITSVSFKNQDVYTNNIFPHEYALKMISIRCVVAFLKSLYTWAEKGLNKKSVFSSNDDHSLSLTNEQSLSENIKNSVYLNRNSVLFSNDSFNESNQFEQFENLKQRKNSLLEGIKQFNQNPTKGINFLLKNKFIESNNHQVISKFLHETDGLEKLSIGEFLGENNKYNTQIMHSFVDQMDFTDLEFVSALRKLLQSFRLPGEAQKIDRFMLKFAEKYIKDNSNVFSNADSAYILAYSVIMLNTDLHSPQIKNRMTFENFMQNNSGIDEGKDLPKEFLQKIYDEICENEIKLESEQHYALISGNTNYIHNASVNFFNNKDSIRESYNSVSKEMSTKLEQIVIKLNKSNKNYSKNDFYFASNFYHVKLIFNTLWMSIFAGLSAPFRDYDDNDVINICLDGIKFAILIACMFDLDYARTSFIGVLIQFSSLSNYKELREKNVKAIFLMLDISTSQNFDLKCSWSQILKSISQIERLKLIAQGINHETIPDLMNIKLVKQDIFENENKNQVFSNQFLHSNSSSTLNSKINTLKFSSEVLNLLLKKELDVAIDKVFTNTSNMSGEAILNFVKSLSKIVYEEIESSGESNNFRAFSLQKVVDICYYNMNRIRLEWLQLWMIIGEIFNKVGCNSNLNILFFALDSLRQLSMRFLEINELSHFKFQKEFLKPFEFILKHNAKREVKEMVLECINNLIHLKTKQIRSGWKTIFNVLTTSLTQNEETLILQSHKIALWINDEAFDLVRHQDLFTSLIIFYTELCKSSKNQKTNLSSLDLLKNTIEKLAKLTFEYEENELKLNNNTLLTEKNSKLVKLWFPVLFAFYDIVITGNDFKVKTNALIILFDALKVYGKFFENDFWDMVFLQILFPIFRVKKNSFEIFIDYNDKSFFGFSTTLIQTTLSLISIFTDFYDKLGRMLDDYLNILTSCICQKEGNGVRIGIKCLNKLILENAQKFNEKQWEKIIAFFDRLFELSTPYELFNYSKKYKETSVNECYGDSKLKVTSNSLSSQNFETSKHNLTLKDNGNLIIIYKSVIQLFLIQNLSELFENKNFYDLISYTNIFRLNRLLKLSYDFAKKFNDDYDLRLLLCNEGIVDKLPNLLKQESSSLSVYINTLFKLYHDTNKSDENQRTEIIEILVPLCVSVTNKFADYDETIHQKIINVWKSVIMDIYQHYIKITTDDFLKFTPVLYEVTLKLIIKNTSPDFRQILKSFLTRIYTVFIKKNM